MAIQPMLQDDTVKHITSGCLIGEQPNSTTPRLSAINKHTTNIHQYILTKERGQRHDKEVAEHTANVWTPTTANKQDINKDTWKDGKRRETPGKRQGTGKS